MKRRELLMAMAALGMLAGGGHTPQAAPAAEGHPFINLPEKYNSPDGMMLSKDGCIYLNVPNMNDPTFTPKLLKIDAGDKISEVCDYPVNPVSGKVVPMGIDQAPDGSFYVADNQAPTGMKDKGRLLRVRMKDGKADGVDVVATGMNSPNAVAIRGDAVYVTETRIDTSIYPLPSGVYRFTLTELSGGEPVKVERGGKDLHLIATFTTKSKENAGGANGLAFNKAGEMFVCNFGDAQVMKCTLDAEGTKVVKQEVFAEGQGMVTPDGMKCDMESGDLYVADLLGNAVHKIDGKTGKVTTLAKNGLTDGANGLLDRCSEVCLRGEKIYVANFDIARGGNVYDKPYTITILKKE